MRADNAGIGNLTLQVARPGVGRRDLNAVIEHHGCRRDVVAICRDERRRLRDAAIRHDRGNLKLIEAIEQPRRPAKWNAHKGPQSERGIRDRGRSRPASMASLRASYANTAAMAASILSGECADAFSIQKPVRV